MLLWQKVEKHNFSKAACLAGTILEEIRKILTIEVIAALLETQKGGMSCVSSSAFHPTMDPYQCTTERIIPSRVVERETRDI